MSTRHHVLGSHRSVCLMPKQLFSQWVNYTLLTLIDKTFYLPELTHPASSCWRS
ncbi:hypothetical protein HOS54_gp208 [Klebsiella phage Menlow]|uniref:Uncharacterized protein n=1 Tax=Klebsiella phage Menlow TaxID=2054273 RepID=A0A2H5BN40_9CAUD|nr:hypothetical protein HOS54_gp208 [Klebsiella phage Menlow]AUG87741.1 hypothetical protein CPT_Menlow_040 [Klebsiella phage Menlow]